MTWGKDQEFFEILKKQGKQLGPGASTPRPVIEKHLRLYWGGFVELNSRRRYGEMSGRPLPIELSDIQGLLTLYPPYSLFNPEQRRKFIRFVFALDLEFRKISQESKS